VLYRLLIKLGQKHNVNVPFYGFKIPFPTFLNWILDNPIARRMVPVVIDRTGIKPADVVLELGPGPGIYTVEVARRAGPEGRLITVDIQPEMIARVNERVRDSGLEYVEPIVADACSLPLHDESIDRAFTSGVLGEIPDMESALIELRRVLKPEGVLSVTEMFIDPNYPLAKTRIRQIEAAGFKMKQRYGNFFCYTLNFHIN
jgi:ubiquinone/menaquinone biosynthesis C-methylase UbiE